MKKKTDAENYFDQAADTFTNAFKTCVRLQEQAMDQCVHLAKGWSDGEDWMKPGRELGEQAMPKMKQMAEDSLKSWEANVKKCMGWLDEGFSAAKAPSLEDAQATMRKLWEESLGAMRENTEAMLKLGSEALQASVDFMKKQADTTTATAAA